MPKRAKKPDAQPRKRSNNFNIDETNCLLSLALNEKHILENKSNAVSLEDKEFTWNKIAEIYNRKCAGCVSIKYLILIYLIQCLYFLAKRCYKSKIEI